MESGIQPKESGIPLRIRIRNPSSNDKYWNPESTAWNRETKTVLDSHARGEKLSELQPSRTPVTRTLKGNEKQFKLAGIRVMEVNFIEILIRKRKFCSSYPSSGYRGSTVVRSP